MSFSQGDLCSIRDFNPANSMYLYVAKFMCGQSLEVEHTGALGRFKMSFNSAANSPVSIAKYINQLDLLSDHQQLRETLSNDAELTRKFSDLSDYLFNYAQEAKDSEIVEIVQEAHKKIDLVLDPKRFRKLFDEGEIIFLSKEIAELKKYPKLSKKATSYLNTCTRRLQLLNTYQIMLDTFDPPAPAPIPKTAAQKVKDALQGLISRVHK